MLDRQIRQASGPTLDRAGTWISAAGIPAGAVTASGWIIGVGACIAAAESAWPTALALWLANRAFDGLDGPVARAGGATERGGLFDIVADFSIYAGFVAGVAAAVPPARLACVVLLVAYYISGTTLLALSSLLERRAPTHRVGDPGPAVPGDNRSLRFAGGLAEGAETVVVYVLFCLLPGSAAQIAWAFAAAVGVTSLQRIVLGYRQLAPGAADRRR